MPECCHRGITLSQKQNCMQLMTSHHKKDCNGKTNASISVRCICKGQSKVGQEEQEEAKQWGDSVRSAPWNNLSFIYSITSLVGSTAFHQGLSKYLTAQETRGTPTLTKHKPTLARLGNLLSLKKWSTKIVSFFPLVYIAFVCNNLYSLLTGKD